MGDQKIEWPEPLLPSPLQPGASPGLALPSMNGWIFTSQQSPLSDFSKAVDLSAEFPFGAFMRLPSEAALWGATSAEQNRSNHEAATRNIGSPMATGWASVGTEGPVSPANLKQQLHDEAEAILSDFRQTLSRSMNLRDSAARPHPADSLSSAGNIEAPPTFTTAVAAICTVHGATPSIAGVSFNSEGCRAQGSLAQRCRGSWSADAEGVASDSLRSSRTVDSPAGSRMKGPQRKLNWEEGSAWRVRTYRSSTPGTKEHSTSRSLLAKRYSFRHTHSHREASTTKSTPRVVPKRLTLVLPTARVLASMPVDTNSQAQCTSGTAEDGSMLQSDATTSGVVQHGQPVIVVQQAATPPNQALWPQGAGPCVNASGLDIAALLADTSPVVPFAHNSFQTPSMGMTAYPLSNIMYGSTPFQPVDDNHSAGLMGKESQMGVEARRTCSAGPLSALAEQQQQADVFHWRSAASPPPAQRSPLLPEASVTFGWLPAGSCESSPPAASRRLLLTPESVATFGHGSPYQPYDLARGHVPPSVHQPRPWAGTWGAEGSSFTGRPGDIALQGNAEAKQRAENAVQRAGPVVEQHSPIGSAAASAEQEVGIGMLDGVCSWEQGLPDPLVQQPTSQLLSPGREDAYVSRQRSQAGMPWQAGSLAMHAKEGRDVSLGHHSIGKIGACSLASQQMLVTDAAAAPTVCAGGRGWSSFISGKALRYDPNGYRSTCSSTELGGADAELSGRSDVTPRADGDIKVQPWQIQENPAFEEDLDADATDISSQLGFNTNQNQLGPLTASSPWAAAAGVLGDFSFPGEDGRDLERDVGHVMHRTPAGTHMGRLGVAGSVLRPFWAGAVASPDATPSRAFVLPEGARADDVGTTEDSSSDSSDSDSPRTTALNRALASAGLGLGTGSKLYGMPRRHGPLLDGVMSNAVVDDDVVDDRRDTATSRAMGSQSPAGAGMASGSRAALSSGMGAEDQSLIQELEHAQTLLLQLLAAANEAPWPTPPPPPSPVRELTPVERAAAARAQADGAMDPVATATVRSCESHVDYEEQGTLQVSACSSMSNGVGNPLVVQAASAAMGKALARLSKLSRDNKDLQRVSEQLRAELSQSSSKNVELQTRSKMLQAMLLESGRQADKKAQSHQRCCQRLEAHLNSSLQRIRDLERYNTQLSLEGRQIARQMQLAQIQVAESDQVTAALREKVALLERQLAAVCTWKGPKLESKEHHLDPVSTGAGHGAVEVAAGEPRWQDDAVAEQLSLLHDAADSRCCKGKAANAAEAGRHPSTPAEMRVQEIEGFQFPQAQGKRVLLLEEQLQAAQNELGRLQAAADAAAEHEQHLQAELQAARVAMAELAAERAAARAEVLRREDNAQKVSLAVQEARGAAELAAVNCARVAAEALEAEQQHEAAIAEAETKAAELRQQLDAAAWELQQMASQAATAMQRAEAAEIREHALQEQLQGALAKVDRMQEELDEARKSLEEVVAVKEEAARNAAAVSDLEMALVTESTHVLELTQRSEQVEAAHRDEVQQLRSQLEAARDRQQLTDTERAELQAAHLAARGMLEQLSVQLAAARSEVESIEQERDHLQSERDRLVEEANKEAARLADAREEASSLQESIDEMQAGQQQLQADLKAAESALRGAMERLAEVQAFRTSMEAELEQLRRELSLARDTAEEVTLRLQAAECDKSALAERVRHLRQDLDEQGTLMRDAEARSSMAETALEEVRDEHQLLRNNLDSLADDLATVQATLREREAQLQAAEEELLAAKEKLQAEAVSQSRALAEAQARGAEAEARAEAAAVACAAAEAAVEMERSKVADLEGEMQVATRKMVELQKLAEANTCATAAASTAGAAEDESTQRRLLCSAADVVASCLAIHEVAVEMASPRPVPVSGPAEQRPSYSVTPNRWSSRSSHGGGVASQAGSESESSSPSLQLAAQVVAASAELADLQRRHQDAEELIGRLRQDLESQCSKCAGLEAKLLDREVDLAAARRAHEDALLELHHMRRLERQPEAPRPAAAAPPGRLLPCPVPGTTPKAWRQQQEQQVTASAVFSSSAWSPSSSMFVERCSMVLPLSPTRSFLRDSIATASLLDEGRRLSLLRGGSLRGNNKFLGTSQDFRGSIDGAGALAASATPISLWVEPGSAGPPLTIGTVATPLESADCTPRDPLPRAHERYYRGHEGGAGATAAVTNLQNSSAHSPGISISLRARGNDYALKGDSSPEVQGFEPLRASQAHNGDGLHASYNSLVMGGVAFGAGTGCDSPTAGGMGLLGAGTGSGGSRGLQLTVQLLELRYAVQKVEQAAGELAGVLLAKGQVAALNTTILSTPVKTSSLDSARGCGGRRQLTANLSDAAAEAAVQERAWLADSLANLTGRAGSVAQQLDCCLDAALVICSTGSATAKADEQRVAGSGFAAEFQPFLSPLAVRVLEAELADLRTQFEQAQQQADQALQLQHAQHVEECAALIADANQYRDLAQRMKEQLEVLDRDRQMDRNMFIEQVKEAQLQVESQHRVNMQLAEQCSEQEVLIAEKEAINAELRQQLDRATTTAAAAATAAAAVVSHQERQRGYLSSSHSAGPDGYRSHGQAHSYGGPHGQTPASHVYGNPWPSAGAGQQWEGPAAHGLHDGGQSTYRESHASTSSIGEACPTTDRDGGGGDLCGNSVDSCGGCGGGCYNKGTAAAGPSAGWPASSAMSSGLAPGHMPPPTATPNSAGVQGLRLELLHAEFSRPLNSNSRCIHLEGAGIRSGDHPSTTGWSVGVEQEGVDSRRRGSSCAVQPDGSAGTFSEDEARLWAEMLQLLKVGEGGSSSAGGAGNGSRSRGASTGGSRRHTADGNSASVPRVLALTSSGEAGGMQLAQVPLTARSEGELHSMAMAAAGSSHWRAEMLARAVSYMSLLSAQNRKLAKLLRGVAAGRTAAAAAAPPAAAAGGGMDSLAARLEALQKENAELRDKYQAAQMAQKTSAQAMRTMGNENRQLHSKLMELIGAQTVAMQSKAPFEVHVSSLANGSSCSNHQRATGRESFRQSCDNPTHINRIRYRDCAFLPMHRFRIAHAVALSSALF
ncbi:hypothetical protein VOLCADRAFT_106095 [Volvox carteri f. nagariensis]|uniref:Uncharacterized protein n=1 Tax=Volvox carteri f. nagariensis TaxID=3068 RepID=D8U518_VOLCA|nr:uncharacterized protein VOLCADRAFT_106095 [Volvox carteri f. nagariensis]EFJ45070.1 hypothetical protein VOLCADRAFT_106095 [Volvox carteri f. nagariensis]|eukprot:XP_002953746.1 hypothetical protein VOLCADRAFT_106095 [Volvox carteri f. nagariensis]